ncbi:MAG: diaminopimelate epimerase [Promethearchaeota archaeon]
MQKIPFIKMHGIGNDYIYIDCIKNSEFLDFQGSASAFDISNLAKEITHRHFGIGGDGLVLILPSEEEAVRMRMFNTDGSESEMCGNAVRCIGGYCYKHGIIKEKNFGIETLAGRMGIEILNDGLIRVDMGKPIIEPTEIPVALKGDSIMNYPIKTPEFEGKFTAVSMGNPHAVYFVDDVDGLNLEVIGPNLENHRFFPKRVNSEFIQVISSREVKFRVWERGAGETWACGTGAAAGIIAGNITERLENKVLFHLKGGDLIMETNKNLDRVWKTGKFTEVATGTYFYREKAD